MADPASSPRDIQKAVVRYIVETAFYAVFVCAYYFFVLHFLGGWLKQIFTQHKALYAAVALAVIIAQALLLELVTALLAALVRGKRN